MSRHLHARSAHVVAPLVQVMPAIGMPPGRSRGLAGRCVDNPPGGVSAS